MTAADAPALFVVDNDAAMGTSIQALLKAASLRRTSFELANAHSPPHRHEPAETMGIIGPF
jgi:hypothetical protein